MSNDLQTQQGGELMQRPEYFNEVDKDDWGLENLKQYCSPPFIKIIQKQAKAPLDVYDVGTVLAVPQGLELFRPGQIFHITPVFQYTEFVLTNPYPLSTLPFIRERSFDPTGDLAKHARDFKNRSIICPEAPADKQHNDKYKCVYFEHINFLCLIHEHEIFCKSPIVFTFRSGEFKTGKNFAGLISLRESPISAGVYQCYTEIHRQGSEENFGFTISNPSEEGMDPWLPKEHFLKVQEMHKTFKKLHADQLIKVDYGTDEPATEPEGTPEM